MGNMYLGLLGLVTMFGMLFSFFSTALSDIVAGLLFALFVIVSVCMSIRLIRGGNYDNRRGNS